MSEQDQRQGPEEIPSGMIRKTRRVRRKRRSSGSSKNREASSLFSRGKELLLGMHEEDGEYGHVDVAEQLRRLKNRDSDDDKPLDEVWGTKKKSSSWLWILLVGIIVPVIAIVIGIVQLTGDDDYDPGLIDKTNLVTLEREAFDTEEGPLSWYHTNTTGVIREIRSIIDAVNRAKSAQEINGLLRRTPSLEVRPIDIKTWGKNRLTNSLSGFRWEGLVATIPGLPDTSGTGYLLVSGHCEDHSPYKTYFVYQDGRVVLDWEASTGCSELTVADLLERKPRKEMLVRCLLEKRSNYEIELGGVTYSGYFVSSPDLNSRIIAYIPLNSARNKQLERDLKATLNYGMFVTKSPPIKNKRVTLKIAHRGELGDQGLFEIIEFEHDDWVSP